MAWKKRTAGTPKAPAARRWLRPLLIGIGIITLLIGSAVGVAALWAFTVLPRSLPNVAALETFQPMQGTKV